MSGFGFIPISFCRWEEGRGWLPPSIQPLAPLSIHPASKVTSCFCFICFSPFLKVLLIKMWHQVLHYAMEVYEGMKAYRGEDGQARLFRPILNMRRMGVGEGSRLTWSPGVRPARRPAHLPPGGAAGVYPPAGGCGPILGNTLDVLWRPCCQIPAAPSSLYIRPCLVATEPTLGLGPSSQVPRLNSALKHEQISTSDTFPYCPAGPPHCPAVSRLLLLHPWA